MLNDFDMSVHYSLGKDNAVVDALSRMNMGSVSHLKGAKKDLMKDVQRLAHSDVIGETLQCKFYGSS